MLDKTIVVEGPRIEDALHNASHQLDTSKENLVYEVLQHGLRDHAGNVLISYRLRILPVMHKMPSIDDETIVQRDILPPFTRTELESWSSDEFLQKLESAIVNQPHTISCKTGQGGTSSAEPLIIPGGMETSRTDFEHEGDIIVEGDLHKNVTLRSAGSVRVLGDVHGAHLFADGDITVSGGFFGTALARRGVFECTSAQGSHIECGSDLVVGRSTWHCTLVSGTRIDIGETVVGGSCSAPDRITAAVTGSDTGVVTKLLCGHNSRIREEAEAVRRKALRLVSRLSETTRDIKQYSLKEFTGRPCTVEERMKLWAAMSEKVWLNDRLTELSRKKNELLASIDRDRNAKIIVHDLVHPQTLVEIDDMGMTVKKLIRNVTFTKDYTAGALRTTSF